VKITPEIARALDTPLSQLPVNTELRDAMKQLERVVAQPEQHVRASQRSAEVRVERNAARDLRVHDARARGEKLSVIAKAEGLKSHATVSRILRKPRP
jgi:hypothetical protein